VHHFEREVARLLSPHREPTHDAVFQKKRDGKNLAIPEPFRDWADTRERELTLGEKVPHLDRRPERAARPGTDQSMVHPHERIEK
jgi:hypothetical protein